MTWEEAQKLMAEGKLVARDDWHPSSYVRKAGRYLTGHLGRNDEVPAFPGHVDGSLKDGWREVIAPAEFYRAGRFNPRPVGR